MSGHWNRTNDGMGNFPLLGKLFKAMIDIENSEEISMAWPGNKKVIQVREDIVELGKDTDPATCVRFGGKKGSDGICRLIDAGVGEDGDVHIRVVKNPNAPQVPVKE